MNKIYLEIYLEKIIDLALQAGEIALMHFARGKLERKKLNISKKADQSLVTIADLEISGLIWEELTKITPKIPIICEEKRKISLEKDAAFWLIDPIDGTNSFIDGRDEFTVNIALIKNNCPEFGLIYAPAIAGDNFFYAHAGKIFTLNIATKLSEEFTPKKSQEKQFTIISSKRCSHEEMSATLKQNKFLENLAQKNGQKEANFLLTQQSSSLKFLSLLQGKGNCYLHLKPTMEWDIAAGHALINAAGGKIFNLSGEEFFYQKPDFKNGGFVCFV